MSYMILIIHQRVTHRHACLWTRLNLLTSLSSQMPCISFPGLLVFHMSLVSSSVLVFRRVLLTATSCRNKEVIFLVFMLMNKVYVYPVDRYFIVVSRRHTFLSTARRLATRHAWVCWKFSMTSLTTSASFKSRLLSSSTADTSIRPVSIFAI